MVNTLLAGWAVNTSPARWAVKHPAFFNKKFVRSFVRSWMHHLLNSNSPNWFCPSAFDHSRTELFANVLSKKITAGQNCVNVLSRKILSMSVQLQGCSMHNLNYYTGGGAWTWTNFISVNHAVASTTPSVQHSKIYFIAPRWSFVLFDVVWVHMCWSLFQCMFAHSLRKFSLRDWSIEQKWMSILLPLLLLYDGEFWLHVVTFGSVQDWDVWRELSWMTVLHPFPLPLMVSWCWV